MLPMRGACDGPVLKGQDTWSHVDEPLWFHDCDTHSGVSGGPIFIEMDARLKLAAILVGSRGSANVGLALSRLLVCCAKMHDVAVFHAATVMASHLSIAAARNCRIVLREIR